MEAEVKGYKDETVTDWEVTKTIQDTVSSSSSPFVQPWAILQDFNINKLQTAQEYLLKKKNKPIWVHETTYFNKHGIHASSNVLHFSED